MTPRARSWIAPSGAALLVLAGTGWAFPDELPAWRSAAIITAWAGSALLVASLLLMVREPRLAAWLGGLDSMYRWHHRTGVVAYLLLLCHPLALAINAWSELPSTAWLVLAPWEQGWPVNLGWVGLLLLMAGLVATLSALHSYRRWRLLHYGLGLGVLFGLGHVYLVLGDPGPLLLLLVLAGAALGWRLLGSDAGLSSHPYRVTAVAQRAARMIEASLAPCATHLQVAPGQFVLAGFGDGEHFHGCNEFHPFTVSGIGTDGSLQVSVKALGSCTRHLQALEPGVRVRLQGPFGTFLADAADTPQLWVAGGVGITPFIAALRADVVHAPTTLIYLYRTGADAAFLAELEAFAAARPSLVLLAESTGDAAADLDRLLDKVDRLAGRQVHACGPGAMVEALRAHLRARGMPEQAIHFESFEFR